MSANDRDLLALSALPGVKSLDIVNNVMLMHAHGTIDLKTLQREYSVIGADYQSRKFPSVTLHFAEDGPMPHSTVKIFSAGTLLCPGCATWDSAMIVLNTEIGFIQRVCPGVTAGPASNSNTVGCMALSVRIDLALLSKNIASQHACRGCACAYTDDFSGIRFRDYDSNLTFLVFHTGKIILTNARTPSDITAGARSIYNTFAKCHRLCPATFKTLSKRSKKIVPLAAGFFRLDEQAEIGSGPRSQYARVGCIMRFIPLTDPARVEAMVE
jgi:TATA-box binding protein (TBP) (component of TFIID and TFIIIB)